MNIKIIILAILVFIGLFLSLFLVSKHETDILKFHKSSHAMAIIPQDIKYYDEVLTMSAYMAAFSKNPEWINRYNKAEEDIKQTLSEAIASFPEISESMDRMYQLGEILIYLEKKSFDFIRENKFKDAQNILLSKKYNDSKQLYLISLNEIIKDLESSIEEFEINAEKRFDFLVLVISFAIVIMIVAAALILVIFRKKNIELKKSKESLSNQHKLLQKIVDSVPVRMFWKDKQGVYLGANKLFLSEAGFDNLSDLIGKNDFDMPWKKDAKRFRDDDAAVIKSELPRLNYEENLPKKDGTIVNLETSKVPLRDIKNNIIGILGIFKDITEQKRLEKEAKEKEKQLLHQSRLAQMGEMIAMIAHQWRQPLAAIAATTASLQIKQSMDCYDKIVYDTHLNDISDITQHLSHTIDDFREFFRDEKQKNMTSLEEIIQSSLSIIGPSIKSKGIEISTQYTCNDKVLMHSNELKQVVLNLLKNAQDVLQERNINNPKITIRTYKNAVIYCLEVKDNGGGISEDVISKIFDPYFTTKDKLNGTGLGLYMSRKIITEHFNGEIKVKNIDNGVSFTVEIPKQSEIDSV